MTTSINPSLGHAPAFTQAGPGASPGYDAIDFRRAATFGYREGIVDPGAYAVTQRSAGGANMSVDIAANVADAASGVSAIVQGDAVTGQSLYPIAAHTSVANEAIGANSSGNPRNDLVILELKDTTHDGSLSNLVQTRVIAGTPTTGASKTDALGANGTPTLPASAMALAVVNVPNGASSITNTNIDDRRRLAASPIKVPAAAGGKCIITAEEARTNTAYGLMTTADRVQGVVLPADGLIAVAYQALWKNSIANNARASLFLGSNQVKMRGNSAAPFEQEAAHFNATADRYSALASTSRGLASTATTGANQTSDVTTGQIIGTSMPTNFGGVTENEGGGILYIFAAAGTYDVSVQFLASSGSVTVKERKLWVWTMAFGAA